MLISHHQSLGESLENCNKQQITDCINFVMHMVLPRVGYTAHTWELSMMFAGQTSANKVTSTPNPVKKSQSQFFPRMVSDELHLPENEP